MKLKHYLFASEHNDYKPWILTPTALGIFCLVIWSLRLVTPTQIILAQATIDATDMMNKINQQRSARFIQTLQTNTKLISAANGKARDMLARSFFAHVDPDGNYVWPRIEATGYRPYVTLGENLAMDFTSADGVVDAWMNSPTHRANIVNGKFEDQGVASIGGAYEPFHETDMVVSLFGTLIKSKSSTATANPPPSPQPNPTPTPKPPPAGGSTPPTPPPSQPDTFNLFISKDLKITTTSLSGHTMVNVDVVIAGSPTLVTAQLKSQSITLISGQVAGQFLGSFTFDMGEDLSNQTLKIEARNKNGVKVALEYPVNLEAPVSGSERTTIPVSNEAQVIKILRIVFGIFATIYVGFLVIDAIIIHRAKIKRGGAHSNAHLLIFALVAAVTLFTNWF